MNLLKTSLQKIITFSCLTLLLTSQAYANERLISTNAGATELIFALQQQDKLVAVDVTTELPDNFPELPNIGYHRNLSAEGILSLKPDLLVGSEKLGPEKAVSTITLAGTKILQLPSAYSPQQLQQNIVDLSNALQQQDKGKQLVDQLQQKLQQIQNQVDKEYSIAFLLDMGGKLRLAGNHTAAEAFINLLGGHSVADFINYRTVSTESLLAMQPDIILVASSEPEQAIERMLNSNIAMKHSIAAQNQSVIPVQARTLVSGLSLQAINEALKVQDMLKQDLAVK